jgi:hypothetical protein
VCLQVHAGNHYYLLRVNVLFSCVTFVGKEKVLRLLSERLLISLLSPYFFFSPVFPLFLGSGGWLHRACVCMTLLFYA